MSETTISVRIRAVVQDLLDKLKTASAGTKDAVDVMKRSLEGLGGSVDTVRDHHESLRKTLNDFRLEARQNAFMARFYANALMEVVPGAGAAKNAIAGLISVGVAGFGIGAGIEAMIFLLAQLKESAEEEEKQAKALKAAYVDTFSAGLEKLHKMQDQFRSTHFSKADDAWTQIIEERNKKLGELQEKIEELEQSSAVRKFFSGLTFGLISSTDEGAIQALRQQKGNVRSAVQGLGPAHESAQNAERAREHEDVTREIQSGEAALQDTIVQLNNERERKTHEINERGYEDAAEKARLIGAVNTETDEKIKRLREDRERAFNARILEMTKETNTAYAQIVYETGTKIAAIQAEYRTRHSKEDQAQKKQLIDAEYALGQRRLGLLEETHDKMVASAKLAYQKMRDTATESQYKQAQEIDKLTRQLAIKTGQEQQQQQLLAIRDRYEQEKMIVRNALNDHVIAAEEATRLLAQLDAKYTRDSAKVWAEHEMHIANTFIHPLANAFASFFTEIMTQQMTAAQALSRMFDAVFKALLDGLVNLGVKAFEEALLEKTINSAKAVAEVTSSAAVGGAAAAAQAAAIPGIGPFIAVGAGEAMMSAILAAFLPSAAAARGFDIPSGVAPITQLHPKEMVLPADLAEGARETFRGGGGVHVHIHGAIDGPSVQRFVESEQFGRAIREAQRNGRLPTP